MPNLMVGLLLKFRKVSYLLGHPVYSHNKIVSKNTRQQKWHRHTNSCTVFLQSAILTEHSLNFASTSI